VQRWRGLDAVPSGWGRCVATIGVFDGVHRGHRVIIGRAVERARSAGLPSVVVTFDPHPAEVVRPGGHPPLLTTTARKGGLLESLGVDVMCVLPFTRELSRLTPDEFVHAALVERLHVAAVVVGVNFRFGHKAAGDVQRLSELGRTFGFVVEEVALFSADDTPLSSTLVRSCVAAGDVERAAAALGRPHSVEGVVVRGDRRGRQLGFPTANIEPVTHAAVPADGVYAGWLSAGEDRWPAAVSVGTNPTFEGRQRRVEAYVLDREVDLYGRHVQVEFVARLREMRRYDTPGELVEQVHADVARTREVLGSGSAGLAGGGPDGSL
jgi:riboflavin kinase/FMN adenylyltransferase